MRLRTGNYIMEQYKKSPNWKQLNEEELKQLKQVMLAIADDFVSVCEKNNLCYCMAYGTALGAVRHRGFIPWDDDMDFYMPRNDYNRFLKLAEKELGERYWVRSVSKGDKICIPTCHIRKKGTYYVNYGDLVLTEKEPKEMKGIYVDIFPLDSASNIKMIRVLHGIVCLSLQFIMSCLYANKAIEYLQQEKIDEKSNMMKVMGLKNFIGRAFGFIPLQSWAKIYDKVCSYNKNGNSKYITCYTGYKSLKKSIFNRNDFFKASIGMFEGRQWNIPGNYDSYLKQIYGDYMILPDAEHRKVHPVFELRFYS